MKTIINSFDRRFSEIHARSVELIKKIPTDRLFWRPRELNRVLQPFSCGEFVLRSAGKIEQTFGGITTRLWDDPFEWTLPEELSTQTAILDYLEEVETTRTRGFELFQTDEDLRREMPAPEKLKTLFAILLECVARAEHFQGRAFAIFQMFSDDKLPSV